MEAIVKEILVDVFDVEPENIDNSSSADSLELWDSLNPLGLITAVEEWFGAEFTMDEIAQMTSYTALLQALSSDVESQ